MQTNHLFGVFDEFPGWRTYQSFETAANDLHFKSKMNIDQISFQTCYVIFINIENDNTHLS